MSIEKIYDYFRKLRQDLWSFLYVEMTRRQEQDIEAESREFNALSLPEDFKRV